MNLSGQLLHNHTLLTPGYSVSDYSQMLICTENGKTSGRFLVKAERCCGLCCHSISKELQRSTRTEKDLEKSNYNNKGIAVLTGAVNLAIFEKTHR